MSDDRAKRAEEIFLDLADLPREQWPAELAARCNGETTLAADVRSLLDCHAQAGTFLDARELQNEGFQFGLLHGDFEDDLKPGTRLGEFLIERLLGRGGMGSVFIATQDKPRRSVALKVIRRGLATPALLRRFEHEAEVLGRLHHPGIAQIYEAGVAASAPGEIPRPYIAMELVNGPTLNAYADVNHLGTRDRLDLVARVCDAVHHAHQRGVIHRDLKPGNILIDEHAQPKVLDFGVARAADADLRVTTMQTSVGQLIGTLPYMSPEQVLADPGEVDTRSDVYALGVILFQLLTGRLPLDLSSRSIPEAARVIKEESPAKLSHVSKVFRGEIDTIVTKAMEKDKSRRYQSAADLAADIRRYLAGEPILARQDSALYFIRKQFRRHRWAVSAAAIVLLALFAFSLYAGWSARTERRLADAATRASREADNARAEAETYSSRLKDQLGQANIERGRLEGALGNIPLAEDVLWREHLSDPASTTAYWGLWELYDRFPCRWTAAGEWEPTCAAIAPDGSVVALGSRQGTLVFYRGATGQRFRTIDRLGANATSLLITPDSSTAVVGLATGAVLLVPLNSPDGERALAPGFIHPGGVRAMAASRDGSYLATGGNDKVIKLWDLRTLTPLTSWTAHPEAVSALALSNDGTLLASGCRLRADEAEVTLWNIPAGTPARQLTRERRGYAISLWFSRDDRFLLAANWDRTAAWYDLLTGNPYPLEGSFSAGTQSIAPNAQGDTVFVGGVDAIFHPGDPRPVRALGRQRFWVMAAAWTGENSLLLVTTEGVIHSVDVRTNLSLRKLGGFGSWCFSVTYSPDGRRLAVGGGDSTIAIARADTLERTAGLELSGQFQRTRAVHFLSDSRTLLAGSTDGALRVIDADTGSVSATMEKSRSEIFSIAVDRAESTVAVGHADGIIRLWNLAKRELITELPKQNIRITGLAFSRDGRTLVSPAGESSLQLWDVAAWKPRQTVITSGMPWAVAYSPDGLTLLATTHAGQIDVFNAATLERRTSLLGHQRLIPALDFSPDGRFFATGSENGTIKLWDAASLHSLVTFEPDPGEIVTVAFDPSSSYLAASASARFTAVYDLHALDDCIAGNAAFHRARLATWPQ